MPEQGGTRVVRVDVTHDDKEHGQRFACGRCPLALAIQRATGRHVEVYPSLFEDVEGEVYWREVEVRPSAHAAGHVFLSGAVFARLPDEANAWARAFDCGDDERCPVPFSFEIEVPQ